MTANLLSMLIIYFKIRVPTKYYSLCVTDLFLKLWEYKKTLLGDTHYVLVLMKMLYSESYFPTFWHSTWPRKIVEWDLKPNWFVNNVYHTVKKKLLHHGYYAFIDRVKRRLSLTFQCLVCHFVAQLQPNA